MAGDAAAQAESGGGVMHEALLAHARKFGVECVYETAVCWAGYGPRRDETDPDLRRLRVDLQAKPS